MKEQALNVLRRAGLAVLGLGLFWLTWWLGKTGLDLVSSAYDKTLLTATYGDRMVVNNAFIYVVAPIATAIGGIYCLVGAFRRRKEREPVPWRGRVRPDLSREEAGPDVTVK